MLDLHSKTASRLVLLSLSIVCISQLITTTAYATQPYLEDVDPNSPPTPNPQSIDISEHLWPRVMMAETQTLAGEPEQYSKYRAIAASGHSITRIEPLQKENPELQYFRTINPNEYLGYNDENSSRICPQGHGNPFSTTTASSGDCGVYAGHWLYEAGTLSSNSITANSTSLRVADASRFTNGDYVVIYDSPAGSFNNAEHARITSINSSNNTLTLQRGFKSNAVSHPSGSIVAQHSRGFGNNNPENWSYNLSSQSPRDANNRTYNQFLPIWMEQNVSNDLSGNPSDAKVSGFLFDADFSFLFRSRNADVNNDLVVDHGISPSGVNWWGDGLEAFYSRVRDRFPDFILIGGTRDARGFDSLNGAQFEGFPGYVDFFSPDPEYDNLAALLTNYSFNTRHRSNGPAHTHILSKTPSRVYPNDVNPSQTTNRTFRFALGLTLLDDGYFGFRNSQTHPDMWFDEYAVDVTPGSPNFGNAIASNPDDEARVRAHLGWLGNPIGPRIRLYSDTEFAPQQALLAATFDSNINDWTGDQVNVSRSTSVVQDGSGSLRLSEHIGGYQPLFSNARVRGPLVSVTQGQEYTYVFSARSSEIREVSVFVGGHTERFIFRPEWQRFVITFEADQTGSSRVRFNVGRESSEIFLDSIYLFEGNANVFRRDFDNGIVVVNATPSSRTIPLNGTFQRINGVQDSVNNGAAVSNLSLAAHESAILIRRANDLPNADVQPPWINISSPTKLRVGPINDTTIVVNDQLGIDASDIRVSSDNTAGATNLNCNQINLRQVNCSITIDRSGDLRISATDRAGNTSIEGEVGFQVNGGTTGDGNRPLITINAPTKTSNEPINDTTVTVVDDTEIRAADVTIRDNNTAGVNNFRCTQAGTRQVNCTLQIVSSGDLRLSAIDVAGNFHLRTENDYVVENTNPGGGNGSTDNLSPIITYIAPTKISSQIISDTSIMIRDEVAIDSNAVELLSDSTAQTSNFSCQQEDSTTVICSLNILSSGEIRISATDRAGNTRVTTESGYEINPIADTTRPFILVDAPTKTSNGTIRDTRLTVRDLVGINASDVIIRDNNTVGISNFDCQQIDTTTVNCTLDITTSGDLRIGATDRAGNVTYKTELGYQISQSSDNTRPFILVDAPTKISNTTIRNTTLTIRDLVGINASDVIIRDNNTVGISNFNCQQIDTTTVNCTLDILTSGDLRIGATDRAGNVTYRSELGYQISQSSDTTRPFILVDAPTKTSNETIRDTRLTVRDLVAIDASDVSIRDNNTVGVTNFNCQQINTTTVNCTLNITSSGDLRLTASDRAGNVTFKTELGYQIN